MWQVCVRDTRVHVYTSVWAWHTCISAGLLDIFYWGSVSLVIGFVGLEHHRVLQNTRVLHPHEYRTCNYTYIHTYIYTYIHTYMHHVT